MLEKLRQKRAELVARLRAILDTASAEDRDLTEEERAEYDAKKAEVEELSKDIERAEELEALEAHLDAPRPTVAQRQGLAPRGPEAKREFETIGEFLHAVRFNPNDQRLVYQEFDREAASDQEMGTGSAGGFMVPQQFRQEMLSVTPQQAAFRPRATVIPAGDPPDAAITMPALDQTNGSTDAAKMYGGVEVNWISEGGTKPQTDLKLREIKLEPQEVAGHIVVTDKLLRNWQAAGAFLSNQIRLAVIAAEEHAFMTGSGLGKPQGVVDTAAAYVVNRASAGTFKLVDAHAMVARLLQRGGSPVWLMSQSVLPQLAAMRNLTGESPEVGDGSLVWNPNARDPVTGMQQLLGYPIFWHERSPALGTKGDVVLADLSYYLIKDGSGPFVAASEHVHFTTNKTVIKIFWNVDGRPWLTAPLTLENGWNASPFVVLDVPA